jgi:glutaredoxin
MTAQHVAVPPASPAWRFSLLPLLLLLGLAASGTALAQFKIVGPDGRITYTDRPLVEPGGKVQPLRRDGSSDGPVAPGAGLPAELRQLVVRFPVTLYTSAECAPCESGRQLLQLRGVPFNERTIGNNEDITALQHLTAGRTVPALQVGGQALRGFQQAEWQSTLDLAGYPRESRLPRNFPVPVPEPLVARMAPAPALAAPPPAEPAWGVAPAASGIRF